MVSDTPCIEAAGCRNPLGYAYKRVNGKSIFAHRAAWMDAYGPIPEGMCVCHHCDNPPCVNPDHLFLGTHADNVADKMRKGRQPRGSSHGQAKLTEETAVWAMARLLAGETQQSVASAFGVTQSAISFLWLGVTWAHAFKEGCDG